MWLLVAIGAALAAWPLSGTDEPDPIQDPFGPRLLGGVYDYHRGLDLDGELGDPVHAVAAGEVVRVETAAQSAGTARATYGNWVLVRHPSLPDGTPVHTAYLHLEGFSVHVGDILAEGDVLGTVGKSGVGTNTTHLHLQAFEGLYKTLVKKEKSVSPFRVFALGLPVDATVEVLSADTAVLAVQNPRLDAVRIELIGTEGSRAVDFETGEGLCGDVPTCDGVTIAPADYRVSSTEAVYTFTVTAIGTLVGVDVWDSEGSLVASW